VESGYISVCELKALKALNMDRELPLDHTQEEIEENLNKLKSKLEHPTTKADINLYGSLKQSLAGIESLDLIWRDPKASMVLSDNSDIVKNLGIVAKCINFVKVFNNTKNARSMKNILHNKKWKESETDLVIITERILGIITSRSEQSKGTYIADVIIPLLQTSLSNLLNGAICLSTAERQSIANEKIIELLYTESSRIVCSNSKKSDDEVKLWRETLDEASYISALCRPTGNQFGIVGIQ
ncbi:17928_t:CDS:2, partial [Rhizophagus irregularis]